MRVAELFSEFQQRQRALAGRELSATAFAFLLDALKRDFMSATAGLDELQLQELCDSLGTQLDNEVHFAGSEQRRQIIFALLRSIEDIEHEHHFR